MNSRECLVCNGGKIYCEYIYVHFYGRPPASYAHVLKSSLLCNSLDLVFILPLLRKVTYLLREFSVEKSSGLTKQVLVQFIAISLQVQIFCLALLGILTTIATLNVTRMREGYTYICGKRNIVPDDIYVSI